MHVETSLECDQLQQLIRQQTDARQRDRLRAVALARQQLTAPQIAAVLGYSRRAVQGWIERYNSSGIEGLKDRPGRGRGQRLSEEQIEQLRRRLDEPPRPEDGVCALRGKDVRRILQNDFGVLYTLDATYKLLHRTGYSCLMPRPVHPKNDPAAMEAFKRQVVLDLQAIEEAHPDKRVQAWFEDEARFGQQGTLTRVWARTGSRPRAVKQTQYDWLHVLTCVCPETGEAHGLMSPHLNSGVVNVFLEQFSRALPPDVLAVLLWDGAGYHTSGQVKVPDNIKLLVLPPYSPELNPVENLWHYLRSHHWSNRQYKDYTALMIAATEGWRSVCLDPAHIKTICAVSYLGERSSIL